MSVHVTDQGLMRSFDQLNDLMEWNERSHFKESKRSFFVWFKGTDVWLLLRKRVLQDTKSAEQCREILDRNAQQSTWFW